MCDPYRRTLFLQYCRILIFSASGCCAYDKEKFTPRSTRPLQHERHQNTPFIICILHYSWVRISCFTLNLLENLIFSISTFYFFKGSRVLFVIYCNVINISVCCHVALLLCEMCVITNIQLWLKINPFFFYLYTGSGIERDSALQYTDVLIIKNFFI